MKGIGKRTAAAVLTAAMALAMSGTALAAGWQSDNVGWWWQEDNGSYPAAAWQWLDGNGDGIAECYYFDAQGYCLQNTVTPDGCTVNADGAWTVDNVVQTMAAAVQPVTQTRVQGQQAVPVDAEIPNVEGMYTGIYQGHSVTGVIERDFEGKLWVEIDFFVKDYLPQYVGNNVFADEYSRYTFNGNVVTVEDFYGGDVFQLIKQ